MCCSLGDTARRRRKLHRFGRIFSLSCEATCSRDRTPAGTHQRSRPVDCRPDVAAGRSPAAACGSLGGPGGGRRAAAPAFRPGGWPRPAAPRECVPAPAPAPDSAPARRPRPNFPVPTSPTTWPATRPVGPPAQTSSNGENSRQRSSPHRMLRAINCPAIAEVFRPWRPKPLATHRPLRNWPICGMPCTVCPTAPPQTSAISTLPSCGKIVRMRRAMAPANRCGRACPGGFRRGPHQPVAIDDPEMIDRRRCRSPIPGTSIDLGKALAERRGHGGIAPDRQQRFRQPPQRRAEMDVAGEHDMRGAQPRRRRHDALADARGIDADDRRVLENPRARPPRQRGKAMNIFAAVDLKRLRDNTRRGNNAPVLSWSRTRSTCQPSTSVSKSSLSICSRLISWSPTSTLETSSAPSLSAMPGISSSVAVARTNSAPSFDSDQSSRASSKPMRAINIADRQAVARHHRAELMAGRIPADMPAFEHGDAGAEPRRLQRHRQAGKPGADHADIDIEIERQPLSARCSRRGVGSIGAWLEVSLMSFSYGPIGRLSPCPELRAASLVTDLHLARPTL